MLCATTVNAYADEQPDRYDEYLQYIEEGWFDESVSYEMWISAVLESEQKKKCLKVNGVVSHAYIQNKGMMQSQVRCLETTLIIR